MKRKSNYQKNFSYSDPISPFSRKNDLLPDDILNNIHSCLQRLRSSFSRQGILKNPGVTESVLDFMVTRSLLSVLAETLFNSIEFSETVEGEFYSQLNIPQFFGVPSVVDILAPETIKTAVKSLSLSLSSIKTGLIPVSSLANIFSVLFESELQLYGGGFVRFRDKTETVHFETGPFNNRVYSYFDSLSSDEVLTSQIKFPVKILDPACGTGINLLSLVNWLNNEKKSWFDESEMLFFAFDRDPRALIVCAFLFSLNFIREKKHKVKSWMKIREELLDVMQKLTANFFCGTVLSEIEDYLVSVPTTINTSQPGHPDVAGFPECLKSVRFDLIIGMVSNHFRPGIDEERALEQRYQTYNRVEGLYPCYIERCFSLLDKNGQLILAVPERIVHSKSASGIRVFVAKKRVNAIFRTERIRKDRDDSGYIVLVISKDCTEEGVKIIEGPIFFGTKKQSDFIEYHKSGLPLDGIAWDLRDTTFHALVESFNSKGTPLKNLLLGKIYEQKPKDEKIPGLGKISQYSQKNRIRIDLTGEKNCFAIGVQTNFDRSGTVSIPIIDYYLFGFLISTVFLFLYSEKKKLFPYLRPFEIIEDVPIYSIDPFDPVESTREKRICALAQMILIISDIRNNRMEKDYEFLTRRIAQLRESLDMIFLDLYELDIMEKDAFDLRLNEKTRNVEVLYMTDIDLPNSAI